MKQYITFGAAILCLGGCMHRPTPTAFYTMPPVASDVRATSDAKTVIDVTRIKIPEYIDRPQIVTVSGVDVNISDNNRWAENPGTMIHRTLVTNLGRYMPNATVKYGGFTGAPDDCSVSVEIYRLDGNLNETLELQALYSLSCNDGDVIKSQRVAYSTQLGPDYSDYASGVGDLIAKMSRDISRDITRVVKPKE